MRGSMRRFAVCAAALILASCTQPPAETGADPDTTRASVVPVVSGNEQQDMAALERLKSEARQLARADGCSTSDQCRAAPMGAKPCGGPWEYLVYCSVTTDSATLHRHLELLRQFEDSLNKRYQRGSTCDMILEPTVVLEGNSCRAASTR